MENADSQPPRCPCGFWGSPQTLNLCSKCYKDELQRNGRTEKNASFIGSKTEVETLNRSGSKQGSGVQIDKVGNQCGLSSPKFMKTECESKAVGSTSQERDTNKEQEMGSSGAGAEDAPLQKKRKRCWTCKAKLELAQRELGNCRCSHIFCQLHRLPEQHNCVFDHKESGRQEARKKMVSPGPRKVGRSFQRIDE